MELLPDRARPSEAATVVDQRGRGEWAVRCSAGTATARSAVGFSRGRYYFEVRVTDPGSLLAVGLLTEAGRAAVEAGGHLGCDDGSWAFDHTRGGGVHKGSVVADFTSRSAWRAGDVLGIVMDLEEGRLTCLLNGSQIGSLRCLQAVADSAAPVARRSGATYYYPAVTFGPSGCDVNLGSAAFAGMLPAGCLSIDPNYFRVSEMACMLVMCTATSWAEELRRINTGAATVANPQGIFSDPVFTCVLQLVRRYCHGRSGPLPIELICQGAKTATPITRVVSIEERPCVVSSSVTVYAGRWYFEMALLTDEAAFSVGWVRGKPCTIPRAARGWATTTRRGCLRASA
ncbi:SPRY domain-containing SOCS box protein 3 [Strigomonas culicis]|uniref:SPRY domain-containing SOCS box protein 3 n=1 Tax=Strigomonas culicis TaxID=28005 RepID=S9UX90_9TRYP|nr:SPRY domain-containing SOCS box protein 3 [Strigomonas culicis]|eukprot:EPY15130.1 SPRY domain-containing SOCS box protein 3 [Strigomonas culicis]